MEREIWTKRGKTPSSIIAEFLIEFLLTPTHCARVLHEGYSDGDEWVRGHQIPSSKKKCGAVSTCEVLRLRG